MPSKYIPQLTFPRFLAACIVVVFHYGRASYPFTNAFFAPLANKGSIAVSFFFFLSGAVLGLNYWDKKPLSYKSFLLKRIARVYPLYLLAFVVTLVLIMVFNNSFPRGFSIILQLFAMHAWVPGIGLEINYPAWSVSTEMFFYFMFPLLIIWLGKLKTQWMVVVVLLYWAVSGIQHYYFMHGLVQLEGTAYGEFIFAFPVWNLNAFVFGILCGYFILEKLKNPLPAVWPRVFYLSGMAGFLLILYTQNSLKHYLDNGLASPLYFLIISGLALDKSLVTRLLGAKIPVLLGDASYAVYLLQFPVYIVYTAALGEQAILGHGFYLYLAILILISIVTYLFFETKMRQLFYARWITPKKS